MYLFIIIYYDFFCRCSSGKCRARWTRMTCGKCLKNSERFIKSMYLGIKLPAPAKVRFSHEFINMYLSYFFISVFIYLLGIPARRKPSTSISHRKNNSVDFPWARNKTLKQLRMIDSLRKSLMCLCRWAERENYIFESAK